MEKLNKQLWSAAEDGNEDEVVECLRRGADINYKTFLDMTPLHKAAEMGHDRVTQILVEGGADINVRDDWGSTPLHLAVKKIGYGDVKGRETAVILVQAGSDISSKDNEGWSPLEYADEELKGTLEGLSSQIMEIKAAFPSIAGTKEFQGLLMRGTYSSHNNRVYLAGACNVGKTTLARNLIGEHILLEWNSTDGLVIYFGRNGIDLEKKEMVPLEKGPQDSSILASVLRGDPSMGESAAVTGMEQMREDRAPSSKVISSSKPSSTKTLTKRSVKRVEDSSTRDLRSLLAAKQKNADIRHSIMEEIRKGEYKVRIAPSDLVDFGGQRAFDLTHQLFIQQKGVFVLLLDGRKSLDEILGEYQDGKMTTKDILLHWVNSILTYCAAEDEDIYPLIVFAATHRDELNKEENTISKDLTQQLTEMFSSHEHCKRIRYEEIFFINATDKNDSGVQSLKKLLVSVAFQQKSWGEQMPMAWVPLELQIAALRTSDIFIVSLDELFNLNKSNKDLALEEKQFKDFLRCQHSLGRLMYFDFQQLDQFIIIQPTAMVDILRSFITDELFWPKDSALHNILNTASNRGMIRKSDLLKLWSQDEFNKYVPSPEIKEFIIQVLVHLDILVEPKRFNTTEEQLTESFIAPCMIRQSLPTKQLPCKLDDTKTIFLSYRLLKSAIPNALAYKLIGAVLNIWPLKRIDEKYSLFDKAAVLEIDQANDLYLTFSDSRFIVALSNANHKNFISPDIASIIQECLTLTIIKDLEFYSSCFGKSASIANAANLFVTEVGEKCGEDICFISLSEVQDKSYWICKNNQNHNTKFPLYWVFDQNQKMCFQDCTGMDTQALNGFPEDKHLIRLAKLIGRKFDQFIIYLGLSQTEWEDIEDDRRYVSRLTQKFVGLCEWRQQRLVNFSPSFKDLSTALLYIEYNDHLLCQIFREKKEVFAIDNPELLEMPNDRILQELSRKIGPYLLHLGVELGIELSSIEETQFRYPKDMFAQTYNILEKWKTGNKVQPTVRALMLALQRVDLRGFHYLQEQYGIKQPNPGEV